MMISSSIRRLNNGIVEIRGFHDVLRNTSFFVKGSEISTIEVRKNNKDIRVFRDAGQQPISLLFYTEEECEALKEELLECMNEMPEFLERDLEQMKAKEAAMRVKIDTMTEQLGELRSLLEQIVTNTSIIKDAAFPQNEQVKMLESSEDHNISDDEVKELSDYESVSDCEEEKEKQDVLGDMLILIILLSLCCMFFSSTYLYGRSLMGPN